MLWVECQTQELPTGGLWKWCLAGIGSGRHSYFSSSAGPNGTVSLSVAC